MNKRILDYISVDQRRLITNDSLRDYKAHCDLVAAILMTSAKPWHQDTIKESVQTARAIIDEVDKQVDAELEQEGYRVNV